ncbi:MAG TPA: 4-(cytidine 5'-diphospho)-2-C-methyl-D-erythritol kinase [Verrucomicrobiae bacterium]|jgi:4-diphosphocytidyl-2-C-methyl-D-erythritol kinase|nr:4-(cytidine 5'-diphospho)-2-C-methyl-D-erythritol kinase [Verrucomicrobiae bacterium]
MTLEKKSPCKVNLLLNILGKRADGFHELETVMHPVNLFDALNFARASQGVQLTCTDTSLPTDASNLVHRAATLFFEKTEIRDGVRIHLEKKIPMAAGLGGGSGNAATTLLGLNELFGQPLSTKALYDLAATLGSDVPFFLQTKPALGTGRGENIQPLDFFPSLKGTAILLVHPGFGISTPWAYQNLARFPATLNGTPGRAQKLISLLQTADLRAPGSEFYNSLEAPALEKYPLLVLFQEFFRQNAAAATLMSGSGSTTFAIAANPAAAEQLAEKFKAKFGETYWVAVVEV